MPRYCEPSSLRLSSRFLARQRLRLVELELEIVQLDLVRVFMQHSPDFTGNLHQVEFCQAGIVPLFLKPGEDQSVLAIAPSLKYYPRV